jgi:Enoyl-CoA hydratase/isomerase
LNTGSEPPAPFVIVEDDGEPLRLGSWAAVVAGPGAWCDVDWSAEVEATVAAAPIASTALAMLLRLRVDIDSALMAESAVYSTLQGGPEFAAWKAGRRLPRTPTTGQEGAIMVDRFDEVITITLNRPQVHNAYNRQMRDELTEALAAALCDPDVRVVLQGAGPSFSSGGDLTEFGTSPDTATGHITRLTRSAGRLIHRLRDRIDVHLHGACMGAGIELSAFAGHVTATADARIALPEVPFGLIPGAGGTASLPPRIGAKRTAQLALTATPIDAATALDWGLIDAITER